MCICVHKYCYSWFHGKISRDEATQRLIMAQNGLFIIRESEQHPGNYALSVR